MRTTPHVIITCALTGAVHTPSLSPALPITASDMISQGIAAVEAGAAILHLHARDGRNGMPDPSPEAFGRFLPDLAEATDAVLNITTGGSTRMSMAERLAAARRFEPELASLNLGSMNFVFSGAARRDREWTHSWEKPYLEASEDIIFSNTFTQIAHTLEELSALGTRFEFECYDVGHLYTLAHFAERGLVTPPYFIQFVIGVLGGIGPRLEHVLHLVHTADALFGDDYYLSAFGAGRHQIPVVTQSMLLGGNARVGLEDSLFLGKGQLAPDNASQVRKAVSIAKELGLSIATPAQARTILQLKGAGSTRIGSVAT